MKKYKLLKDLPTWNAGEEFILKEDGNLYGTDGEKEIMAYRSGTLSKFDILNNTEWFEEIIEKPNSVFDLKIGDEYFFFNGAGFQRCVERREIDGDYEMRFYRDRLYYGNVFLTEKEARKELNERIAIRNIKKYCWENGIDNMKQRGCCFVKNLSGKILIINSVISGNPIGYFSYEDAQKILDNFKEELKIILE